MDARGFVFTVSAAKSIFSHCVTKQPCTFTEHQPRSVVYIQMPADITAGDIIGTCYPPALNYSQADLQYSFFDCSNYSAAAAGQLMKRAA